MAGAISSLALAALGAGHFVAMAAILLPFAALSAIVGWQIEIRVAAGLLVIGAGLYLLLNRRHPRVLARIRPNRLALWSLAIATAHGAGLMLVPIYLGICSTGSSDAGHGAAAALIGGGLAAALAVALVHATAMLVAGGIIAVAVYRWLGPAAIARSWFNLEAGWALSLVVVGSLGVIGAGMAV